MLIDTHCHLNMYLHKRFGRDINSVLNQIQKNRILTVTTSLDETAFRQNLKIAKKSKYIIPTFGVHPWNASKYVNKIDSLKRLIKKSYIIGEIGLDYFFVKDKSKYAAQRRVFEVFLKETRNKVISVHTKGAEKDALRLLKRHRNKKVIIHWYSGDMGTLKKMIKEGYYFSVGPEIMFSDHSKKIVKSIPLKRILTETDNPGGPESIMGKKGMPILIKNVVVEIAQIKKKTSRQIEKVVEDNFKRLTECILPSPF
ncbi:TatD family hydrolase [Candidatus Woesearchaeota archaeon]|nr:TatD family hydrolase [Candidatus Woesearchaeota archaeon]